MQWILGHLGDFYVMIKVFFRDNGPFWDKSPKGYGSAMDFIPLKYTFVPETPNKIQCRM